VRGAKPSVQPGAVIDGFIIGECVHRGGMATPWSVTRADFDHPLLMKIPLMSEGEDPAAIVSFEMEQVILPRLSVPLKGQGGGREAGSGERLIVRNGVRFSAGVVLLVPPVARK
jgi:hypothetical protein